MRNFCAGAVLSAVMIPCAAQALTYNFQIVNIEGNFAGALSGTVDGLVDNVAGQGATSLKILMPPSALPGALNGPIDLVRDFGNPLVNSFSVSAGEVTSASFAIQVFNTDLPDVDPNVFESLIFVIDVGVFTNCCGVVDNGITFDDSFTFLGNSSGSTGTVFTKVSPIPLPAGAPLLLAGILGFAIVQGAAFCKRIAEMTNQHSFSTDI